MKNVNVFLILSAGFLQPGLLLAQNDSTAAALQSFVDKYELAGAVALVAVRDRTKKRANH